MGYDSCCDIHQRPVLMGRKHLHSRHCQIECIWRVLFYYIVCSPKGDMSPSGCCFVSDVWGSWGLWISFWCQRGNGGSGWLGMGRSYSLLWLVAPLSSLDANWIIHSTKWFLIVCSSVFAMIRSWSWLEHMRERLSCVLDHWWCAQVILWTSNFCCVKRREL